MAKSTKSTYKPAKKGNYKSVVRMAEGGNVSELNYSERREYIEENYAPFITDAQMIFSIWDSGIEYDYKSNREEVISSIIESYKALGDYTETTLPQETIYEIQDWDLVRKEIDPETDEVISETPLEELSADNTYNFSYNGLVDLNWRVYHDEEYDRFFYVIMPHLGGDIRGNYGDAIILEGNDKEELFYRFYEGFISGGASIYIKFKDGSEIAFDSEQDSDVFYFRVSESFEPTGMAQKYLNDFEQFETWQGDEFLEETIDIYLARKGVAPKMMAGGSLNDETPMAYIQILGYDEGQWFNLTDYSDGQDVIDGIFDFMNELNNQFGGNREEFEVTDYEGFGDDLYDRYMGANEFEEIIEAYEKYESSDFPADVISAYKKDSGSGSNSLSDVIDEMDNNYFGKYDNLNDFGYEMVQQGVYEPSDYDVYITDTDKRIIAGEESDSLVNDMSFDDLMNIAPDTQSEYEDEKSELEDKIVELQEEIKDLTELQNSVDDDDEYETIAEQIEEKEIELEDAENSYVDIDSRFEDKAREEARDSIYDEIYDKLENDLSSWLEEYGYTSELQNLSFLSVDYENIGEYLSSDYLIVEFDGDMYFFNNYAKGGRITASKRKPKFAYYIVESSTKKLVSGYSTKAEANEQRKLLVQQYPSMRFEIYPLANLEAKTDLDVYAKKDYVELSTLDKIKKVSVDAYRYGQEKVGQAQVFLEKNDVKGKIKRGARKVWDKTKQGGNWLRSKWLEADFGDGTGRAKFFADGGSVDDIKSDLNKYKNVDIRFKLIPNDGSEEDGDENDLSLNYVGEIYGGGLDLDEPFVELGFQVNDEEDEENKKHLKKDLLKYKNVDIRFKLIPNDGSEEDGDENDLSLNYVGEIYGGGLDLDEPFVELGFQVTDEYADGGEIIWVDNFELDQDKINRAKYIIKYNRGNYTIIDNKTKKAITSFPTQISAVNYINTKLNKFADGGVIEVVGKANKGAFRNRDYEGMTEKEVIQWWEERGYKLSKTKSESSLKPYTFYINKFADGGETMYRKFYAVSFWLKDGIDAQNWIKENGLTNYELEIEEGDEEINGNGYRVNVYNLGAGKYNTLTYTDDFIVETMIEEDEYASGGAVGERLVGTFYYDTRKDKSFQIVSEDGTDINGFKRKDGVIDIGIQYYDNNKQPIGKIEIIDKGGFEYYVQMGAYKKYQQPYFSDGGELKVGDEVEFSVPYFENELIYKGKVIEFRGHYVVVEYENLKDILITTQLDKSRLRKLNKYADGGELYDMSLPIGFYVKINPHYTATIRNLKSFESYLERKDELFGKEFGEITNVDKSASQEWVAELNRLIEKKKSELENKGIGNYKVGDEITLWRNQADRDGYVLAVDDNEMLVEYEMPNGTSALNIIDLTLPEYDKYNYNKNYKTISYDNARKSKKWSVKIDANRLINNPQGSSRRKSPTKRFVDGGGVDDYFTMKDGSKMSKVEWYKKTEDKLGFEKFAERILKDSQFGQKINTPSNELTHNRLNKKAVIGKKSVTISSYTPNYNRYLDSKTFDNLKELDDYLNENQILADGGETGDGAKYEVILKSDKHYGQIGFTHYGIETDNRGVLFVSLEFPNGVNTYSMDEVRRVYANGGMAGLGEVSGMLPNALPMSTITPMADGGKLADWKEGKFINGKKWYLYKYDNKRWVLEIYKKDDLIDSYYIDVEELENQETGIGKKMYISYSNSQGSGILIPEMVQVKVFNVIKMDNPKLYFGENVYDYQVAHNKFSEEFGYSNGGGVDALIPINESKAEKWYFRLKESDRKHFRNKYPQNNNETNEDWFQKVWIESGKSIGIKRKKYDNGGKTEEVYIEFLNKEKGYKEDVKHFNSYEEAVEWARKNFDKFDSDMIKYKYANGGGIENAEIPTRERTTITKPTTTPTTTPSKPDKDSPYKPKGIPKPKATRM